MTFITSDPVHLSSSTSVTQETLARNKASAGPSGSGGTRFGLGCLMEGPGVDPVPSIHAVVAFCAGVVQLGTLTGSIPAHPANIS